MAKQAVRTQLAKAIARSQLPGDEELGADRLDEIVTFLAAAAGQRKPDHAAIVVDAQAGERRLLRIAVINEDMPFLVDSIAATLAAHGLSIDLLLHPVIAASRDEDGALVALGGSDDVPGESLIYIETARIEARQRREVARALAETLGDVRLAVHDWPGMVAAMQADAAGLPDPENRALLEWLAEGMLTQLGHVLRDRSGSETGKLGICRKPGKDLLAAESWTRAFAHFDALGDSAANSAPLAIKANRIASVHRAVPLDLFIVPVMKRGKVSALSVHAGIWTSAALNTPPDRVPRLRRQFAGLAGRLGFDPGGHTGKALLHALTALPNDLLAGFDEASIASLATRMSSLAERPRPRLALIAAPLGRHLFAFVWLPRDLISTEARRRIQAWLEAETGGQTLDWALQVEEGALAMLRFVLDIRGVADLPDEAALDSGLQAMLRGWLEAVETALGESEDAARAATLAARYAATFPTAYRLTYGPAEAARDIVRLRRLDTAPGEDAASRRDVRLIANAGEAGHLRLKIYQLGGQMPLSDAVPTLENFGFRVLSEVPSLLDEGRIGTIHDFTLDPDASDDPQALLARSAEIEAALGAVLRGQAENDPFNRLVTTGGLSIGEVEWLRAIYRYLRQAGLGFAVRTAVDAMAAAGDVTRALVALFRALHDPQAVDAHAADAAREAIGTGLARVHAINDDKLLRLYHALIEAVLRTNAFVDAGREALAFKIDSAQVPGLPKPVPWREIFVHSARVEGIHLRAGPVARGGLRWSDRRDDFRAEVLGLMKAQRVKNAVIVPTGAKGGFYPKQLPDPARDRDGWAAEGQASYQVFIRALLSLTDNIVGGKVVHPEGLVVRDGPDPYFVVAADKGTARFSDLANAIAAERGFWLGDAFASGGSNGYDHKAMGITARGAWLSVQRHFQEMGIDVQADPVRVIGCGDMSGDVFGNGMLLSRAIRLVAAFDHRHIFIDPDPDPAAAWKERKRLFGLPRSSWDDYDKALISRGGGVWPRSLKRIPVSAAMRKLLDIAGDGIEPDALISAILRARADLLWFGGIGTFVKASHQNHIEVEDPSNDAVRVDADELRVRAIGEGANLGITQAGRIEFALAGGRINTDFIDNSAGVDCSDNEVNIKIALAAARAAGKLSEARRKALLAEMTDKVAALVLEDNRLQALALSVAERGGSLASAAHARLIQMLEDSGELSRETEGLADDEIFIRRAQEGAGLARPELAVLLSSAKLALQAAIEASDLSDDAALEETLFAAFPRTMRRPYARFIAGHRLRREIVATKLANRVVNRLGPVHPFELAEEAGANLAQVARAFVVAEQLFDLTALWQRIERGRMDEDARLLLLDRLADAVRLHMADLLRAGAGRMAPGAMVDRLAGNVAILASRSHELLKPEARRQADALAERLVASGAPRGDAAAIAHLFELDGSAGLALLAADIAVSPIAVTSAFTEVGEALGLDWAQATAAMMEPSDTWERLLVAGLARDLQQVRLDFLRRLARRKAARADLSAAFAAWLGDHAIEVRSLRAMVARARASTELRPAILARLASQARGLLAG